VIKKMRKELDFSQLIRPAPRYAKLSQSGCHIWCGSMVRDDSGLCHLFYSRWPSANGFQAWVSHSEVARAVSENPLGPYRYSDVSLSERGEGFWDGFSTHNPSVKKFGDKYYIYYTGNFGDRRIVRDPQDLNWSHRNNQQIGVAVADHPAGPWQRFDRPIIEIKDDPENSDLLCVSNPSVTACPHGYLMIYKAVERKRPLPFGGPVVHRVALAEDPKGPFKKYPKSIFTHQEINFAAEDPYVWYSVSDQRYYAIVKDMGGYFTKKGVSLALFCSEDGFLWETAENVMVSGLSINWEDGGELVRRIERPQLWFENDRPAILFAAVMPVRGESFNVHIPLKDCYE